ncbi:MAG: ADP-glyceromanno-heptose 6-epimerase [Proteobacteria bacterium]|jgi:ADP-L-glycero-D-manno-heptose 6-epimerase|nr:ADP-glyceromanno-heptose 6-epimerase [Pseudomonadota bacterium]
MIIVVTGAFGFIGSNIIRELNKRGFKDIIAVDDLTNGNKIRNLIDCDILDFVDKDDFIAEIVRGDYDNQIDYIIHQGACSDTTLQDGQYMMKNNYDYSALLLEYTQKNEVPLLYASSAAVYGAHQRFVEKREFEGPLNVYGYSKFLFDQMVRRYYENGVSAAVVGLRYFNVYGNGESHKDRMASVVLHNFKQYQSTGKVKLFEGSQGYGNGEQTRDFISIEDVVKVNMFFFENHINDKEEISGIFNCGTGNARSYNDLSLATVNACRVEQGLDKITLATAIKDGIIEYIPFPNDLANKYQCYTQADVNGLREAGFNATFSSLEDGISHYVSFLRNSN